MMPLHNLSKPLAVALAGAWFVAGTALAEAPPPLSPQQQAQLAEVRAAGQAAKAAQQIGPKDIPLAGEAVLHLPSGFRFIPGAEADRYMVALGNTSSPGRLGLIVPVAKGAGWLADIEWKHEGHVPDGDAKEWQPDAMLESLRQGTEAQNKARIARGIPALDISGWVEPPSYDATGHRLVWSLAANQRGAPAGSPQNVNYNTFVLGREGYITLDMITDSGTIAQDRTTARMLLGDIAYDPGKRYQDFNPSTDRVAAYGLAALVGAVAIKKLGLLAVIGVFLLKIWKLAMVAVFGGWAALKRRAGRLFGRRPAAEPEEIPIAGEQEA